MGGGVGHVTLAEAINRSGVPRPSAYRLFGDEGDDPLRAFQDELMIELTRSESALIAIEPHILRDLVGEILDEVERLGVEITSEQLTHYLADMLRQIAELVRNPEALSSPLGVHLSLLASTVTGPVNERLQAALRESREGVRQTITPFLREVLRAFGLKLRPGWRIEDLCDALINAFVGALLSQRAPASSEIQIAGGQRNGEELWSPLGAMMLAIIAIGTTPDPRMVVSADPGRWAGIESV